MRNPKYLGVYSRIIPGSKKSRSRGTFHFVWDLGNGSYAEQELDDAFLPKSSPRLLSARELKSDFRPEVGILAAPVSLPDFRRLQIGATAETAELSDENLAQLEKARKARQIENDLRDNFNKAIRALSRPRDRKGALAALEQLANTTNDIVPGHKHMFRDFGVSLRKKSLPELALVCAKRAVELAPNDDHAHFNIARILSMLQMYDEARAHLAKAMSLDKSEKIYSQFDHYLQKQVGGS